MKRRHLRAEALEAVAGYLFASPVILGLLIWVIAPMIGVLLISLTDWNVLTAPHWVGVRNYVKLFTSDLYFWNTLKVTAYYVVLNVACTTLYSLVVAMLLNQNIRGRGIYRSIFYLPDHRAHRRIQRALAVALQPRVRPVQHDPAAPWGCPGRSGSTPRPPWSRPSFS